MTRLTEVIHALVDVTATTTSQAINIQDAQKVSIVGQRSDNAGGSSAFSVEVSADGTNWIAYNKLIDNVTNTNTQNLTRVTSKTISADNGFIILSMDLTTDVFLSMRVTVTETTEGTHNVWVIVSHH